jgi:epoxyqueuosine reductase QueG
MNFVAEERRWYAETLLRNAASQRFFSFAILRKEEWEEMVSAPYQLESAGAMLVAALRYAPDVEPIPAKAGEGQGKPLLIRAKDGQKAAIIGRFARANWYREMIGRLAAIARVTSEEAAKLSLPVFPIKQWHRFSNSRFPEKALAVAAGLGTIGRNGLLIARQTVLEGQSCAGKAKALAKASGEPLWSSAVVLGLMLLPFDITQEAVLQSEDSSGQELFLFHRSPLPLLSLCGACSKCVDACPTHALALADSPCYERARCIQNYTSIAGALPGFIEAAWTTQLYGCDKCLEACPYFKPDPHAYTALGRIGGTFDAASIAAMSDDELRAFFKGSALDQKWIVSAALRRNAELVESILKPTRI